MKIIMPLTLSAVLMGAVLAGCSSGTSTGGEKTEAPQADKKYKLTYLNQNFDKTVKDSYAVKYVQQKFNVEVEQLPRSKDNFKDELLLKVASGEIPDVWVDLGFPEYEKLVNQGAVAEIPQELIEKNAPRYWAWLKKHLGDDPLKLYRRDGKNYSMPIIQTLGPDRTVVSLRKDWLDNVGITKNPETLEEFEDAMRKFRNNDPDKNGKKDTYGWTGQAAGVKDIFSPVFGAFGVFPGTFTDKNGKIIRGEIEPGAKQALTLLNKWYKEELIDPEFVLNKGPNVDDKVISSKVGIVTGSWYQFIQRAAFFDGKYYEKLRANVPNASWLLTAGPKGPDGQQGTVQLNPIASSGGQFGKHMEKDKGKMAKYLQVADATAFDAETFENIVYGEKGKTYKKGDKGDYIYLPPYDKEEEQIKFGIGQQYTFVGKSFNDYEFQTPYMTLNEMMPIRRANEHIGKGKYDILQPIQIPAYNENIDTLDQMTLKYFIDMITGQRPVSDFDKYVEEWKKAGGSKVMEEAQKKYEENFKK
ncbi:extracellular solute-binding protein [Paenibacillus sp. WQ 127069]|uniref:Extracellular solute-binding protein n=1 Tax=Paenibacillus baimaensis TaxID=2982185 RepID=A0ABT2ULJ1_9BACL|nr:extracellular solute-binding protein [Paenibacillus sp. WQ 127069]MCU6794529.1 extracellular solute-binding protein [Paenibacillus sp. WQ 127069]